MCIFSAGGLGTEAGSGGFSGYNPGVEIVHADEALIVVNKPAGLPVMPDGWDANAPYLIRMLKEQYGGAQGGENRIWVVHRLDKTTSGVLVFALTAEAHRELNRQFEQHEAEKIYRAILEGLPDWDERTAKHPLRAGVGHKHRTAVDPRGGRPAETRFTVLRRFAAHTLIEARLMTGRTHQIRAHAYALGHPLLGDVLYSAQKSDLISRPALHSYSLTITHPQTGQRETYSAPYPEDFLKALERLDGHPPKRSNRD
jgi:RluA family pseudouridine synthase